MSKLIRLIWEMQNKINDTRQKILGLDDPYFPDAQIRQEMKHEIYRRCQNTLEDVLGAMTSFAEDAEENSHQQIGAAKEIDSKFIWHNEYGHKIKDCIWRYVNIRTVEKDLQSHPDINHDIHQIYLYEDIENTPLVIYDSEKERNTNPQQRKVVLRGRFNSLPQKDVIVMSCNGNFYDPLSEEVSCPDFPEMTIVRRK